jgi:hypothetical protein
MAQSGTGSQAGTWNRANHGAIDSMTIQVF